MRALEDVAEERCGPFKPCALPIDLVALLRHQLTTLPPIAAEQLSNHAQ
jgi:hypothetical protein